MSDSKYAPIPGKPATEVPPARDPTSQGNHHEARMTHFHLALTADFERRVLFGSVELDVEVVKEGTEAVVLDTNYLVIKGASQNGAAVEYVVGDEHGVFGRPLRLPIPADSRAAGSKLKYTVEYETTPAGTCVQWLDPSQTAGKKHPYLFTQAQAIHARSFMPIQDTPGNKTSWTASITVPAPLVAIMGAEHTGQKASEDGKFITYSFSQPILCPSYLIALAVGALEKREIGPRSVVWSEKEFVDLGAYEFAETEKFIQACEALCGPYVWGRYDILLMPPSFPYGGMENPCLTFVTPTLLAGDRSLTSVVCHEIAHSWMGNLITCQNWESFWLNEGFTVFLERKALKALFGEQFAHLQAVIGHEDLLKSVDEFGHKHSYTCMHVHLEGVDPDDSFSSVPYEKGFQFLHYLEGVVGTSLFEPFMGAYCKKFAYSVITSELFKEFFLSYFKDKVPAEKLAEINWEVAYHHPGMPVNEAKFDYTLVNAARAYAEKIVAAEGKGPYEDISKWSSSQMVVFLKKIASLQAAEFDKAGSDAAALAAAKARFASILSQVGAQHKFGESKNAEVRFAWLTPCIRSEMESEFPGAVALLTEQGRMKFVRPLFRDLFRNGGPKGKELAYTTFEKLKGGYHAIAAKMVGRDLGLNS